jgi:acetyl esterase/lipase
MKTRWMAGLALVLALGPARAEDKPEKKAVFEVETIKDVAYTDAKDADPVKQKLDLYLPKGAKDFPVLVFIHGGGWTQGDRKSAGRFGTTLAKHGIGLVSVGYRLSPKVKHPAHIEDVAAAFAWVKANIAKHGGKPDQLFISGHSAGGHLAGLLATNETFLKAHKLALSDIKGAIPISGVFTVGGPRMKNIFGEDADVQKEASPLTQIKANDPPFLILYADKELGAIGKGSEDMAAALKKAKVETTCVEIKDRNHGTIMAKASDEDDPTLKLILEFIAKHSGAKTASK